MNWFKRKLGQWLDTLTRLVVLVDRSKPLGSLYGFDRVSYTNSFSESKTPESMVRGNCALNQRFLFSSSTHFLSFLVLGLPREALPPRAASSLRWALVSAAHRALPAFLARAVLSAFGFPFQRTFHSEFCERNGEISSLSVLRDQSTQVHVVRHM